MGEKGARDDDGSGSATSDEEMAVRGGAKRQRRRPRGKPWCRCSSPVADARKRRRRALRLQEQARQRRHAAWADYWLSQRVAYRGKAIAAGWAVGRGRGVPAQLDAARLGQGTVHFTLQCHGGGGSSGGGAETLLLASAAPTTGIQGGAAAAMAATAATEPTPVRIAAGRAFVNIGALAARAAAVVRAVHAAAAALPPPACADDCMGASDRPRVAEQQQQRQQPEESVAVDFTAGRTLPAVTLTLTPPGAGKRRRPHRSPAHQRCLVLPLPLPPGTVTPSSLQSV